MKYLYLFFIMLAFLSCEDLTPHQKAERSIRQSLNYLTGYKADSFGNLDTFNATFFNTSLGKKMYKEYKDFHERLNELKNGKDDSIQLYYKLMYERNHEWIKLDSLVDSFKPVFYGYFMNHKFRIIDNLGNERINDSLFCLDSNFNVVKRDTIIIK